MESAKRKDYGSVDSRLFRLLVGGEPANYKKTENGIVFTGEGGGGNPLSWEVEFQTRL